MRPRKASLVERSSVAAAEGLRRLSKSTTIQQAAVLDVLSDINGHYAATAQVAVDEKSGRVFLKAKNVEVSSKSSLVSVFGSIVAFVVLAFLGSISVARFFAFEPSINEVSVESAGVELTLPDIAFTINVPD